MLTGPFFFKLGQSTQNKKVFLLFHAKQDSRHIHVTMEGKNNNIEEKSVREEKISNKEKEEEGERKKMVAIALYRGNLHRVPNTPRRWPPPPRTLSASQFKSLLRRRSLALSRLFPSASQSPSYEDQEEKEDVQEKKDDKENEEKAVPVLKEEKQEEEEEEGELRNSDSTFLDTSDDKPSDLDLPIKQEQVPGTFPFYRTVMTLSRSITRNGKQ
jgi:hypothetical protein